MTCISYRACAVSDKKAGRPEVISVRADSMGATMADFGPSDRYDHNIDFASP